MITQPEPIDFPENYKPKNYKPTQKEIISIIGGNARSQNELT